MWDRLRRQVAAEAGGRCEICGGRGRRWPVECHEVWHYDDDRHVQRLERLVALCPACHKVKHAGLASERGRLSAGIAQLADVNRWSPDDAALYLEAVFETWRPAAATSGRSTYRFSPPATGSPIPTDAERDPTDPLDAFGAAVIAPSTALRLVSAPLRRRG